MLAEVGTMGASKASISSSYTQSGTPWNREAFPEDVTRMGTEADGSGSTYRSLETTNATDWPVGDHLAYAVTGGSDGGIRG